MPRESSVIHFSLFVFHSSLQNAAVAAFWSFLHLIDDNLYVSGRDLAVVVEVVAHILRGLRLLHLVDDNLYAGCRVGCLSSN